MRLFPTQVDEARRIDCGGRHPRVDCLTRILAGYPGRKTVIDIGAGHCLFSIAAAGMGMQVTAVDARLDRIPNTIKQLGISFRQADINAPGFEVGNFDVVLLLGILYHLTLEQQLSLLRKCSHALTIVDTHCAADAKVRRGRYRGSLYIEDERMRKDPRSAFTSAESFWHRQPSLVRMFRDCGYRRVIRVDPPHAPLRWFFVCEP